MSEAAICIWQVTHGPNKGMWAWVLKVDQKTLRDKWRTNSRRYGRRCGLAMTESIAQATADRQLKWHIDGDDRGQIERSAA